MVNSIVKLSSFKIPVAMIKVDLTRDGVLIEIGPEQVGLV